MFAESGNMYTWGRGGAGQLGHENYADSFKPKRVSDIDLFVLVIACFRAIWDK